MRRQNKMGKLTNFAEVVGIIIWDIMLIGIIYLGSTSQLDYTEAVGNAFTSGFFIALLTVATAFATYEIFKKNITEDE